MTLLRAAGNIVNLISLERDRPMKLSAHFDLLNERPRCRIDDDRARGKIEEKEGGEFIEYTSRRAARCSNLSRLVPIRSGKIGYLC